MFLSTQAGYKPTYASGGLVQQGNALPCRICTGPKSGAVPELYGIPDVADRQITALGLPAHGMRHWMDILLVDDSKTMRMIVQRAIRQAGFRGLTVCEAENGLQGLEKLGTEKPKLILSDWNMPEMSGIDFLVQVRAANNKTPFGFITSEASAEIKDLAMSSGANFLITKPFSPEDVQEALSPILG